MVSSDSRSSSSSNSSDSSEGAKVQTKKVGNVDKKSHEYQSKAEDRISSKHHELERRNQKPEKSKGSQNAMQRLEQGQAAIKAGRLEKKSREDKSDYHHDGKEDEKDVRGKKRSKHGEDYLTSHREEKRNREDYQSGPHRHDKQRMDKRERTDDYEEGRRSPSSNSRPSWENNRVRRHAEQIQQRKLLWGKAKQGDEGGSDLRQHSSDEKEFQKQSTQSGSKKLESSWTSMFAAASSDSSQLNKFQRLMGMKKVTGEATASTKEGVDASESAANLDKNAIEAEKKRQREMTEKLDQQYALARATTHQARGRGLGFM